MGNSDHPLHRFDDTQKAHEDAAAVDADIADAIEVQRIFTAARVAYRSITPLGGGRVVVEVEPQRDVQGRIKRLYDAMRDGRGFGLLYGVSVETDREAYWLTKR